MVYQFHKMAAAEILSSKMFFLFASYFLWIIYMYHYSDKFYCFCWNELFKDKFMTK